MAVLETIHSLLTLAVENGASDTHIKSDKPAFLRLSGHLESVEMEPLSAEDISEFIDQSVPERFFEDWSSNRQVDYSYHVDSTFYSRDNGFFQPGPPGVFMRHVADVGHTPPTFEGLHIHRSAPSRLRSARDGIVTSSGRPSRSILTHGAANQHNHILTLDL
jgi:twitching motility protein PilT